MEALSAYHGSFTSAAIPALIALLVGAIALGYVGAPMAAWILFTGAALYGFGVHGVVMAIVLIPLVILAIPPIRRQLITKFIMDFVQKKKLLPVISDTEKIAINAGSVWVEGEIFSGRPNLKRLLDEAYPKLTDEEQAFIDGPVEELCRMVDDWKLHTDKDLTPEAWEFLKENRFLGFIIPKKYGGLGFSPLANSAVVHKLASHSAPLAVTVMVPNSLGPAELLVHYGTDEQKEKYLPKLANGEEIPCFALTEPGAGSDAGAMTSSGTVFKDDDGELKIRINFSKRYITLATISSLLGLAFKLNDPEELLGKGKKLGITCALIPTDTPGVDISLRHDPLGIPFVNSKIKGEDVVIPIGQIIGGADGAGHGWRMLMECLSAGRGISLPALAAGGSKGGMRYIGAYAQIRKQFGLSIGKFEGIEEPLARIGGFSYALDALRTYTCGALAKGEKPSVITAASKYYSTELGRQVVNDAMDISGGAGISQGPRNVLASRYKATPISITVEGANILTRTLMIFGQGLFRAHPYVLKEVGAIEGNDLAAFDKALFGHLGFVFRNVTRAKVLSLTRGLIVRSPVTGPMAPYFRKLAWASAVFASFSDFAMGTLAGDLKRKEKLTGRFADMMSWMYIATAIMRRYEEEQHEEDLPFAKWSLDYAFSEIQRAYEGLLQNLPALNWIWSGPVLLAVRISGFGKPPSDKLGGKVAALVQTDGAQRDRLTSDTFAPDEVEFAMGRIENAFKLVTKADPILGKIKNAVRKKELPRARPERLLDEALEKEIITEEEADLVREAEAARDDAVLVDSFTQDEYMKLTPNQPEIEHALDSAA